MISKELAALSVFARIANYYTNGVENRISGNLKMTDEIHSLGVFASIINENDDTINNDCIMIFSPSGAGQDTDITYKTVVILDQGKMISNLIPVIKSFRDGNPPTIYTIVKIPDRDNEIINKKRAIDEIKEDEILLHNVGSVIGGLYNTIDKYCTITDRVRLKGTIENYKSKMFATILTGWMLKQVFVDGEQMLDLVEHYNYTGLSKENFDKAKQYILKYDLRTEYDECFDLIEKLFVNNDIMYQ